MPEFLVVDDALQSEEGEGPFANGIIVWLQEFGISGQGEAPACGLGIDSQPDIVS
jgi:hypothetical protein